MENNTKWISVNDVYYVEYRVIVYWIVHDVILIEDRSLW